MKKILVTLIALVTFSALHADDPRLSVWGAYSLGNDVAEMPSKTPTFVREMNLHAMWEFTKPSQSNSAATIGVDYRFYKGLYLGLSWTTGGSFSEVADPNDRDMPFCTAKYKVNFVCFNSKYEWLKLRNLRLYSRAGIGIAFSSRLKMEYDDIYHQIWGDDASKQFDVLHDRGLATRIAWQATPLGVEYKPWRFLGIFAEGGFGNQGNFLAGARGYAF